MKENISKYIQCTHFLTFLNEKLEGFSTVDQKFFSFRPIDGVKVVLSAFEKRDRQLCLFRYRFVVLLKIGMVKFSPRYIVERKVKNINVNVLYLSRIYGRKFSK